MLAKNVAKVAAERGVNSLAGFFSEAIAKKPVAENMPADLIVGHNVLAIDVPRRMRWMKESQFDTIHYKHFSCFSFANTAHIFSCHSMVLFHVEERSTHDGSLKLFACHDEGGTKPVIECAKVLEAQEFSAGLNNLKTYRSFGEQVKATKRNLLEFLSDRRRTHIPIYPSPEDRGDQVKLRRDHTLKPKR